MIITKSRSRCQYCVDIILTMLGWLVFAYLIVTGMLAVLALDVQTGTLWSSPLLASVASVLGYALLALVGAATLVGWAKYNQYRFRGKDRRKRAVALSEAQLRASFAVAATPFDAVRNARSLVIQHDDDGNVLSINAAGSVACAGGIAV